MKRAKKVFLLRLRFTDDAKEFVLNIENKIVLISGEELVKLMIDHDVAVREIASYKIKAIDLDYFSEE